jgi:phosphoglycerate dehydrogenase-like enzyme
MAKSRAAKTAAKTTRAKRIRVHVINNPKSASVYDVTEARFRAAIRAHDGLAKRLEVSYGGEPAPQDPALAEAEVLLSGGFDLTGLKERAPRLKWLQSTSAGVEKAVAHIPDGVTLTNASGVHGPKGGEYGMTALLMLNHRVPHFVTSKQKKSWDQAFAGPIAGKTVLFLGVGAIGSSAAKLAKRFDMKLVGVGRKARPDKLFGRIHAQKDLKKLLPKADFVLVTAPLTPETRGLLGKAELDLLPKHAGIVNLGRGPIIDYDAMAAKLAKGELSGAVVDVYPEEPLPASSPLWDTPNFIMSPHCAVDDAMSYVERALDIFFANMKRYVAGRPLLNRVDLKLGY